MHKQNFIHRDLKLANVLFDGTWRPRVCDFGRARSSSGPQMSIMEGTPQTMAPEVLTDEGTYTNKADVYLFGVCLCMFFRDANHFEGDAQPVRASNALLQNVAQGKRFIREPSIPDFYWDLITACWDGNPQLRPSFRQIVGLFRGDKQYAFPGTDMEELARYEHTVVPPDGADIPKFIFGRPETAEPCVDLGDPRIRSQFASHRPRQPAPIPGPRMWCPTNQWGCPRENARR